LLPDIAVITGASKGIGRAAARMLAAEGLHIIAVGRNEADLKSLVREIEQNDGSSEYMVIDLTETDDVTRFAGLVADRGQPAILIHSAGLARVAKIENINPEDWHAVIAVNLTAPFYLTQKLLPYMRTNSRIFFINSVAGKQVFPEWAAYCASKFGLRAMADALRQELVQRQIHVTTLFPASVDTPMQAALPYDWDTGKMLRADDVARAIVYCCRQPHDVVIKELHLENPAGLF